MQAIDVAEEVFERSRDAVERMGDQNVAVLEVSEEFVQDRSAHACT
nr:hypothetical protein [Burkholderia cepacia]